MQKMAYSLFLFLISTLTLATSKADVGLKYKENLLIQYGSPSWNSKSTQIDSASLLIRDAKTGKMAQIQLEETEPDSSVFSGSFNLNWSKGEKVVPQVYIPPQSLRNQKNWLEKVSQLIQSKKLKRKPFIFKKDTKTLEVFDTTTQAKQALKAYREELQAQQVTEVKLNPKDKKPLAAAAAIEAAKLASALALEKQRALEAARRETERVRMEQIEKQRELERIKRQKALAAKERQRRKEQAKTVAALATKKYFAKEYEEAVRLYEKSIDLDPSEKLYYFQYGVSLYKVKQYNKSIVILKAADSESVNSVEREYYIALNHFRLNESDAAINAFEKVKNKKHKTLSPSAAFYQGVIEFQRYRYEQAKPHFEFVLDNSQDPRLDDKAESYIEQIARILFFAKQREIKYFLSATLGLQYDSNILLLSQDTLNQDTQTNEGGLRMLGVGGFKWRPIYEKSHELTIDLDTVYYYSFNEDFSAADPFLITLSSPYTYKTTLWDKSYKLDVTPGYELLYMDAESTGNRDKILASVLLDLDNTFVMSGNWLAKYTLGLRLDDSSLNVDDPNDNQSATKITVATTQTYFLNKPKTKIALGNFGVSTNDADGQNNNYLRFDLSGTYLMPLKVSSWNLVWSNTLGYYNINYSDRDDQRKDNNIKLNSALSKKISKEYGVTLSAEYMKNSSNVDDNAYTKFTVLTTFSANYSF